MTLGMWIFITLIAIFVLYSLWACTQPDLVKKKSVGTGDVGIVCSSIIIALVLTGLLVLIVSFLGVDVYQVDK